MRSFEEHRERVRACGQCHPEGSNAPPVVDLFKRTRVLLVAQVPGTTEARERLPFVGPASRGLVRAGRDLAGGGLPLGAGAVLFGRGEGWWGQGAFSGHELLGKLPEAVGRSFCRDGVVYVPLPHPSGASTGLNAPENRERLWCSLAMLKDLIVSINSGEADA